MNRFILFEKIDQSWKDKVFWKKTPDKIPEFSSVLELLNTPNYVSYV